MRYKRRAEYCYVYVLCSQADHQFYVGLTRDLPARLQAHNDGRYIKNRLRCYLTG